MAVDLTCRRDAAALRIRHLSKSFTGQGTMHRVLADVTIDVAAGAFVVFLGPSGCGKSTLLRIVAGLDMPDPHPSLELTLDGKPITGPGPDRGFVFQSYSSFPWLTAKENVMFGLKFSVRDRAEREHIASTYLSLVGLADRADAYPRDLSGGQKQRVAIARTLANRPRVLLMDEPYAALDAFNREYQQIELRRIWAETHPTILFVTHDISEAVFLGTRVIVLGHRPATVAADVDVNAVVGGWNGHAAAEPRDVSFREHRGFYELVADLKHRLPPRETD